MENKGRVQAGTGKSTEAPSQAGKYQTLDYFGPHNFVSGTAQQRKKTTCIELQLLKRKTKRNSLIFQKLTPSPVMLNIIFDSVTTNTFTS